MMGNVGGGDIFFRVVNIELFSKGNEFGRKFTGLVRATALGGDA